MKFYSFGINFCGCPLGIELDAGVYGENENQNLVKLAELKKRFVDLVKNAYPDLLPEEVVGIIRKCTCGHLLEDHGYDCCPECGDKVCDILSCGCRGFVNE